MASRITWTGFILDTKSPILYSPSTRKGLLLKAVKPKAVLIAGKKE